MYLKYQKWKYESLAEWPRQCFIIGSLLIINACWSTMRAGWRSTTTRLRLDFIILTSVTIIFIIRQTEPSAKDPSKILQPKIHIQSIENPH